MQLGPSLEPLFLPEKGPTTTRQATDVGLAAEMLNSRMDFFTDLQRIVFLLRQCIDVSLLL